MAAPVRAVRGALAQVPRTVIAATIVFGLLLVLWSTALPLGDAPDETAHADLVFHLATGASYPRHDGRRIGVAVQQLCLDMTAAVRACPRASEQATPSSIRVHTKANAPPKDSRPDFIEDGGDKEVGTFNQMLQHPPLYYWSMSWIIRAERFVLPGSGLPPLDREFALLRLANVLLIAPLPLLAWWACRRLGLADAVGIVASLIPLAIPQLSHIGSTLNNDNLLTLLAAVLTVLLAGVVRGDVSLRTAAAIGVVTGLALLTKGFALVLPLPIAAAYFLAWWRNRPRREPVVGLILAGLVSASLGGWWYLRNVVRGDGLSPSTDDDRLNRDLHPRGFHADPVLWARKFATLFTERFWGWFGWFTVRISIGVIIGATVVLLAAMSIGLSSIRKALLRPAPRVGPTGPRQVGPIGRLDLGVLLLPAAVFGAFVMARSWSLYSRTSLFAFIQGRYVFGGIVGIAGVAAVGLHRLAGRWAAAVTFGWVVVMQAEGLRRVLSGYWGARGSGPIDQVRALVAWSTWPDAFFGVGAIALIIATAWLAFEIVQITRREAVPPSSGRDSTTSAQTKPLVDLPGTSAPAAPAVQ